MENKKIGKSFYNVIYSKMGETLKESFSTLDEAIKDYDEKVKLDRLGYFDDRFVIGIEDSEEVSINIVNHKLSKLKSLAIITARGGSKRIPKKKHQGFLRQANNCLFY